MCKCYQRHRRISDSRMPLHRVCPHAPNRTQASMHRREGRQAHIRTEGETLGDRARTKGSREGRDPWGEPEREGEGQEERGIGGEGGEGERGLGGRREGDRTDPHDRQHIKLQAPSKETDQVR